MTEETPSWPSPPREPGPWGGGPPVAPPGNTALPPLPGASGVVHGGTSQVNPWGAGGPPPPGPWPPVPGAPGPAPFPGLDRSRGPLVARAPGWVLALSGLVVLALVAGAVLLVTKGGRTYPSKWDPRVDAIARWVEKDRKLTYEHPVEVQFLTAKEYTAQSTGGDSIDGSDSGTTDDTKDQVGELRALGFVSGALDLKAAGKALADSGTLAFYDQDAKKVFVRGTKITPALRVTLAHELTHVLQDQHFDLVRIEHLPDNQAIVLRALAEGDATHTEDNYAAKILTKAERDEYEKQSQSDSDASESKLDKVPPVLTTFFAAPYILGPGLLAYLRDDGGDKAVDKAFTDVPTEEELFNPLIYNSKASEAVEVKLDGPKGTEAVDDGEFGPTAWYLLLATRMDARQALAAVDGWGGDHYVTYRKGADVCVQAHIRNDTADDTKQMFDALTSWAAQSPADKASARRKGDLIEFRTCDPGKDAKAVGDPAKPDLLALPAARTELYRAIKGSGAKQDQAKCFANAVIERLDPTRLNDDAYGNSPEVQKTLAEIGASCR